MRTAEKYTSSEAASISGVPFFTVDYWHRSRFLQPTVSQGSGRGKGRERMYSYGDILRLRIARELRDQDVSLETLRKVISKLAPYARKLHQASYVLVGNSVQLAAHAGELVEILQKRGKRRTFAILLDLTELSRRIEQQSVKVLAVRRPRTSRAAAAK